LDIQPFWDVHTAALEIPPYELTPGKSYKFAVEVKTETHPSTNARGVLDFTVERSPLHA
jgi:hypothetical protein